MEVKLGRKLCTTGPLVTVPNLLLSVYISDCGVWRLIPATFLQAGALDGEFVDATAFQTSDGKPGDPITYFGDKLEAAGYSRLGGETMISGITGEEFPVDIFIGTVYYQVTAATCLECYPTKPRRQMTEA